MAAAVVTARVLVALAILTAGPALAQRLDGPEIVADCQYGAGVLRLCKSGCAAQADIERASSRSNNDDRLRRLRECNDGCWGIAKALEDCRRR